MPRRHILTERQRATLFDLPTLEAELLRHYTLADDDIEHIRTRRNAHNRLGFALQLCAFRQALLHKSPDCRTSPIPGQTYPTTSVTGMPRAVKPFRTATLTWNSAT